MKFQPKVPLFADSRSQTGEQEYLRIWNDDEPRLTRPNMYPHLYVSGQPVIQDGMCDISPVEVTPLSSHEKEQWARLTFRNRSERDFMIEHIKSDDYAGDPDTQVVQTTPNYMDEIVQKDWGFFSAYPMKRPLRVLTFDIEQKTDGSGKFPTPDVPLISIAWKLNDDPTECIMSDGEDDSEIVKTFAQAWADFDPDVVVGFHHCGYDVPYLAHKFKVNGITGKLFNRDGNDKGFFEYKKKVGPRHIQCIAAAGRLYYDVYHAAITDQTLHGVGRGLKAVARHYAQAHTDSLRKLAADIEGTVEERGFFEEKINETMYPAISTWVGSCGGVIEEVNNLHRISGLSFDAETIDEFNDWSPESVEEEDMRDNRHLIGTQTLVDYNVSDVDSTYRLFCMYFQNNIACAEFVNAPLNRLVPLATSYTFTQIMGKTYHETNMLPDQTPKQKYPWAFRIFDKKKGYERDLKDDEGVFRGALVDTYKIGLYAPIVEADIASMYPSIQEGAGISPDNTMVLGTATLEEEPNLRVVKEGEVRTYYVPDSYREWTWIIRVDGWSPVAAKIGEFKAERVKMKQRAKVEKDDSLLSIAYGLKVTLNSAYGVSGSRHSNYGDIGVAALTTGLGREILMEAHRYLGMDTITNCDTDGLKTTNIAVDVNDMNAHFDKYCQEVLLMKPTIEWEVDPYDAIYTTPSKKNYMLKHNGKYTIHGASLKSTRAPKFYEKILDKASKLLLDGMDPKFLPPMFMDLSQYEPEDFSMTVRLAKSPKNMKTQNTVSLQLARIAEAEHGIPAQAGNEYKFLKVMEVTRGAENVSTLIEDHYEGPVNRKYDIYQPENVRFIDHEFYVERIRVLMETLGAYRHLDEAEPKVNKQATLF